MNHRVLFTMLLAAMAIAAPGCRLPHNTPGKHLDQVRPVVARHRNVLPPAQMLMHPGPGVGGPGPGVLGPTAPMLGFPGMFAPTSQVGFIGADGMKVMWDVTGPGLFDSEPLIVPGRYNFGQGAIYRVKLTEIPGRPGVELFPTLEVAPASPRTEAYLAHNFIPFQLTDEDFDQVLSGNFVTKVIYLPDAEHQELALAGVETLVSTRLDPGVDPIVEADRKGSIMAIIRIGNKDLQVAGGAGIAGAGYQAVGGGFGMAANGGFCGPGAQSLPPQFVAGVTAPMYGMPITGTPIGLPGPPHIPLGVPAGLQQHVMRNHTHVSIPGPTERVTIDVKQKPGLSYPKPANHVHITEKSYGAPPVIFHQPAQAKRQIVGQLQGGGMTSGGECADGNCAPGATAADSSYEAP